MSSGSDAMSEEITKDQWTVHDIDELKQKFSDWLDDSVYRLGGERKVSSRVEKEGKLHFRIHDDGDGSGCGGGGRNPGDGNGTLSCPQSSQTDWTRQGGKKEDARIPHADASKAFTTVIRLWMASQCRPLVWQRSRGARP